MRNKLNVNRTTTTTIGLENLSLSRTVDLVVKAPKIEECAGSVAWLVNQPVMVVFEQLEESGGKFRVAHLAVNGRSILIAADGAVISPQCPMWHTAHGYHDIELELDSWYGPELAFGVALTPAAVKLLERIAAEGRVAFARWIEDEGEAEAYKVRLVQGP